MVCTRSIPMGRCSKASTAAITGTIIADVPPVSKGEFHRGLVRDRVKLATVDDIVVSDVAERRLAAVKL